MPGATRLPPQDTVPSARQSRQAHQPVWQPHATPLDDDGVFCHAHSASQHSIATHRCGRSVERGRRAEALHRLKHAPRCTPVPSLPPALTEPANGRRLDVQGDRALGGADAARHVGGHQLGMPRLRRLHDPQLHSRACGAAAAGGWSEGCEQQQVCEQLAREHSRAHQVGDSVLGGHQLDGALAASVVLQLR